jgi:hypothetical protein
MYNNCVQVIYDTLLSRIQLREKMAQTVITMTDVAPSTQVRCFVSPVLLIRTEREPLALETDEI